MAVNITLVDTLGEFDSPSSAIVAIDTLGEFDEFMLIGALEFRFKRPSPTFVFKKPTVEVKVKKPTVEVFVI